MLVTVIIGTLVVTQNITQIMPEIKDNNLNQVQWGRKQWPSELFQAPCALRLVIFSHARSQQCLACWNSCFILFPVVLISWNGSVNEMESNVGPRWIAVFCYGVVKNGFAASNVHQGLPQITIFPINPYPNISIPNNPLLEIKRIVCSI